MKTKRITFISVFAIASIAFISLSCSRQQGNEPWTEKQLMSPVELTNIINDGKGTEVFIYNIGPAGHIKNSIDIGPGKDKTNIEKLKKELNNLPKDATIVIYCGCCPFKDCPNIRPAFSLLNEMQFTNQRLLNLPKNLKVDWIDKGFPMNN